MTQRALLSVSDKEGIVDLARGLVAAGVEVVSTGGTARELRAAGVTVTDVADISGFPEIMGGRVKTLHPAVHAGLLARRGETSDMASLGEHGIAPIDWLVVNLYPFRATIEQPDVTLREAIEQIDVGGPTMIRAAAKNHEHVAVVVDPVDYPRILRAACGAEQLTDGERVALAAKAFRHTAAYDAVIAQHLSRASGDEFPEQLTITLDKVQDLRYGENPHQGAAFYAFPDRPTGPVAGAVQLQGKELSYNNIADADVALALAREFEDPVAVVIKHTNPCGVGVGTSALDAWQGALAGDPVSVFGGIVAFNRTVDADVAKALSELFLEVVLAPGFHDDALELLSAKTNLRLLAVEPTGRRAEPDAVAGPELRMFPPRGVSGVDGGVLIQHTDRRSLTSAELEVVTRTQPTDEQIVDLLFAWRVVKHVKSNAVVLAHRGQTVGVGAGQMNRVGAARIAIEAAGSRASGSVLASDAFFPMPDTVEVAAAAGVEAIIQPGGSRRDADSIAAADAAGIAMVFTGVRHFRH